jgi:hypothetical protein
MFNSSARAAMEQPGTAPLLPLTCPAPDIVEAILDGRQPKRLRLAGVLRDIALPWEPPAHSLVLSLDEKPAIQALERAESCLKLPNGQALTSLGASS